MLEAVQWPQWTGISSMKVEFPPGTLPHRATTPVTLHVRHVPSAIFLLPSAFLWSLYEQSIRCLKKLDARLSRGFAHQK